MHSRVHLPQCGMQQHQQFLNKCNQQQEFKQYPTTRPVLGIPNIPQKQALSQLPVLQQNAMLIVDKREIAFGIPSYTAKEQHNRYEYTSQYPLLHQHLIRQQYISQSTYGPLMLTEQTNRRQIQFEQSLRNNEVLQRADVIFKAILPNYCNAFQVESTNIQSGQQQQLSLYQRSQDQSSASNRLTVVQKFNTKITEKESNKREEQLKYFTAVPQCNFMGEREIDNIWKKIKIIQRDRRQLEEQAYIVAKSFQLANVSLAKAQPNTMQFYQQQKYIQTPSENTLINTFCRSSSRQQLQKYEMPQMSNYTISSQDNQSRQEQKMLVSHVKSSTQRLQQLKMPQMSNYTNSSQDIQSRQEQKLLVNHVKSSTQRLQQYEMPQMSNYTNSSQHQQSRQEQKMLVNHVKSSTQRLQQYEIPQMSNYTHSSQDNQSRQEQKLLVNHVKSSTQRLQQLKMPQMTNYTNSSQHQQSRQKQKMSVNHVETCLCKINESCSQCNLSRDISLMFDELKPILFGEDQDTYHQELQNEVKTNANRPHSISEVDQEIDVILRRMQTLDRHQKRKAEEAFKTGNILQLSNVKSKKRHTALRQVSAPLQSQHSLQQKQENCQTPSENVLPQNNNYLHSHQTTQSQQGGQTAIKHKTNQTQSSVQDYKFNQQHNFSSATISGKNPKLFREHKDIETILNDLEEIYRPEQQKHEAKSNVVDALQLNYENSIFEMTCMQIQIIKLLTDVRAIKNLSSGKLQIELDQLLDGIEVINLELRKWTMANTNTKNRRLLQMIKLFQNNLQTISELTKLKKKERKAKI